MKRISQLLVPLILGIGLISVLVTYAVVVEDLPSRIYTPVQHAFLSYNRGRMIVQEAPMVNYLSADGVIVPATLMVNEHTVRATLIGRYEERDCVSATAYDLDFRGEYHLAHSGSPNSLVEWLFPFPANLETLHDVRLLVDDREPVGVDYSTQGIRWTAQLEAGEERNVVISYRAEGSSSFSYSLPRELRVDVDVIATVEGLVGSESPRGFLRPTSAKELQEGELFAWTYENLIADRDIQLALPVQLSFAQRVAQLQDDFRALSRLAPVLVLAFLAALAALFRLSDVRLQPEVYLMAAFGLALFFPLLTFSSGLVDIPVAATLSLILAFTLLIAFLGRVAGGGRVRWRIGLLLLVFLGFFSIGTLTPWRGLSHTAGGVLLVALFMVLLSRRPADRGLFAQAPHEPHPPKPLSVAGESGPEDDILNDEFRPEPEPPAAQSSYEPEHEEAIVTVTEPAGLFCPFCGNQLGEAYHFCPTCGHQTDQISACPDCGTKQFMPVEQERVHCLACGAAVVQGRGNPIRSGWDQRPSHTSG